MQYKIPLILTPQLEGGYTATSPLLPELITEGDTVEEALENVKDALAAVRIENGSIRRTNGSASFRIGAVAI
jgi:antitoxin HicB